MKRDCAFYVADKTMRDTFEGFLSREDRCLQLGCGHFDFVPSEDLFFAGGQNDPGIFTRGGALVSSLINTHKKLVIALDCDWDGSPGQAEILSKVTNQLHQGGWAPQDVLVIAIEPELEQWIWQDSPVLAAELRMNAPQGLKAMLGQRGLWPAEAAKPPSPKDLFIQLRRENNVKLSSSIFKRIASKVPVAACEDGEFRRLLAQLRAWFPMEVPA